MESVIEIGIVDTRKIISAIYDLYGYDFKNYALTFFKHRIEKIIVDNNLRDADHLIEKLTSNNDFIEVFIQGVSVETTELFRDPSLWRIIRDDFFPDNIKDRDTYKIWMAGIQSGEELYSMAILLEESSLWDKVELTASYESSINYELIKKGVFNVRKIELNDANYKRFNCFSELNKYYSIENKIGYWDTKLIRNIKFLKQNVTFDNSPKNFNLVWFRNQMIYYNQVLQDKVLETLYDSIVPGGHLVIGDKETVEHSSYSKKFKLINDTEKIFKRL
ncbi:MAG: hypothetical protein JXB17_12915 [Bacteroidales bacterium]|nr:hypothetical protein [Bacteroidales bacterium]